MTRASCPIRRVPAAARRPLETPPVNGFPPTLNKNCRILLCGESLSAGLRVQPLVRVGQSALMQKHRSFEVTASAVGQTSVPDLGSADQRRRIVDAMIDSCAEKTYAATTITDIVARAHISRTTFYKQFDDKRECFDAAIACCIGELQGVAATAHSPT